MTDMDWAKKMVDEAWPQWEIHEPGYKAICDLLRKAKADGMREAAKIAKAEKLTGIPPIGWTLEQISLVEGAVIATKDSIAQNLHIAANLLHPTE